MITPRHSPQRGPGCEEPQVDIAVPLATYTGWNFRNPSIGQPDELLPLTSSFLPFPATKTAREQTANSRQSIEERYGSRTRYEALVRNAAAHLVEQRYLLDTDVPVVIERDGELG